MEEKKQFTNLSGNKPQEKDVGKLQGNIKPLPVVIKSRSNVKAKTVKSNTSNTEGANTIKVVIPDGIVPKYISLKRNVQLVVNDDEVTDYSEVKTYQDVITLDKSKPNAIIGFEPPIYNEFINSDRSIKSHINIQDLVTVKRKFMDKKGDIPREVRELYFKSLNNMTVIVAVLNDGEYYLLNQLEKCK